MCTVYMQCRHYILCIWSYRHLWLLCGCKDMNPGLLKERKKSLLTTEMPLSSPHTSIYEIHCIPASVLSALMHDLISTPTP